MRLVQIFAFFVTIIVGFFLLLYWSVHSGDERRRPDVTEFEIERLKEAWSESETEYLECNKELGSKYRYPEVAALRASMCTAIAQSVSKLGEEWKAPVALSTELPKGFTVIEEDI